MELDGYYPVFAPPNPRAADRCPALLCPPGEVVAGCPAVRTPKVGGLSRKQWQHREQCPEGTAQRPWRHRGGQVAEAVCPDWDKISASGLSGSTQMFGFTASALREVFPNQVSSKKKVALWSDQINECCPRHFRIPAIRNFARRMRRVMRRVGRPSAFRGAWCICLASIPFPNANGFFCLSS